MTGISGMRMDQNGVRSIEPMPTESQLREYYRDRYFQNSSGNYRTDYSEQELRFLDNRIKTYRILAEGLMSQYTEKSLLDVGCGEGYAMAHFSRAGYTVEGIDYSLDGVRRHNPDMEDRVRVGEIVEELDKLSEKGRRYSVVSMSHVIEHVRRPKEVIKRIGSILERDGLAIITVPNDFSVTQREARQRSLVDRDYWICAPDHLHYFSLASLKNCLGEHGWEVVEAMGSFPIEWFLYHSGSNYVQKKELGKEAHLARIAIDNMMHLEGSNKAADFYRSLAAMGMGRDITVIAKLNGDS